jgi:RHS repeat-associated protein
MYDIDGRLQLYDIDGKLTYAADDSGNIPSTGPLELQAVYSYYLHGPLKRVELASNLQGIDYLYTADGALKSINHADPTKDPGKDGIGSSPVRPDVFGMTLDYYTNDYVGANEQVENISMPETYADQYSGLIKAMRWHSPVKSTKQFAYAYSYDERNQFTNADWGIVTPNPTDLTGPNQLNVDPFKPYQEGVPDANGKPGYDANGNINFLQRNSNRLLSVNGFDYDLAYHYETNSNKLLNITNGDNTSLFRAYQYNGLGQMITEAKDDKTSYITYDVSGKVTGVYADVDHTQPITTFLYDDRGFRLSKTSYGTNFTPELVTWYVRNASGDVLSTYEDNLDADGALATEIPIYGSGRIGLYKPLFGNSFYELSDHLGNTRAVIGKVITNEVLATMEDERSETESEQFVNLDGAVSSFNHTPSVIEVDNQKIPLTSPGKVSRINNGIVGGNSVGVGQWLPVEPGDVIDAEVYVKYANFQSNSYNPVTDALSQVETSFINHSIIDGVSIFTSAVTPVSVIIPASTSVHADEPLAFLNYLLYDKHGNLVRHANVQVSSDAEITADKPITFEHERLSFNLTIEQGGFLYVFVSNLTNENLDVYFDDLRIKQTMSNIVAGGDYYPYGLAIDDRQIDRQPFRYGYQGKNAEKDDETGWNHFELREYDPVVGRWLQHDPKGQFYSPYIGMGNNPIYGIDPDGGIVKYEGSFMFRASAWFYVHLLRVLSPTSRARINNLEESQYIFTIKKAQTVDDTGVASKSYKINDTNGVGSGADIEFNFSLNMRKKYKEEVYKQEGGKGGWVFLRAFGHELTHADDIENGNIDRSLSPEGIRNSEVKALKAENLILKEIKWFDINIDAKYRKQYSGVSIPGYKP